ncbi:MAG: metallophosphoesterase [Conexivisphaerales archaeon]
MISDTHIGFEEQLSKRGLHVPSQSGRMAERLLKIKERYSCNSLVILGDVKDSILGLEPKTTPLLNSFFSPIVSAFRQIHIVPGNHDAGLENLLPSSVSLTGSRGLMVVDSGEEGHGKIALLHGHAYPARGIEIAKVFVMGHMHLILNIGNRAEPLWVRCSFRIGGDEKMAIIVPPFNELLTGYMPNVEKEKRSSFADYVLRSSSNAEALLLDGRVIGDPRSIGEALAEVEY